MPIYIEKQEKATVVSEEYPNVGYFVMPMVIMMRKDILPSDKLVYQVIDSFVANEQDFYGSNAYIERKTGLSENTVQSALKRLEELNLIQRTITNQNERVVRTVPRGQGGGTPRGGEEDPLALGTNTLVYTQVDTNKEIRKNSPTDSQKTNTRETSLKKMQSTEYWDTLRTSPQFKRYELTDDYLLRKIDGIMSWDKGLPPRKQYKDFAAVLRQWITRDIDKGILERKYDPTDYYKVVN